MGESILFAMVLIVTVCNVLVGIAIGRQYEREHPVELGEFTVCDWCKTPEEIAALFAERCGTSHNNGSMPRSEPRAVARLP